MKQFTWRNMVVRISALALAGGVWLAGSLPVSAQRGRPIEFSHPKGSGGTVSTNLQQLTAKQLREDLLQQKLRDDLFKSLEDASRGSLDGMMVPPAPGSAVTPPSTAAQRQRARELYERRKYWLFLSQEELARDGRLEEFMNALGEESDPTLARLSPIERFYLRLAGNAGGATNDARNAFDREWGVTNGNDRAFGNAEEMMPRPRISSSGSGRTEPSAVSGLPTQQESLLGELFKVEPGSPLEAIRLPELMPPLHTSPPADLGAQTLRRQQFQQLLESPATFLNDPLQGLTPRVEPNRPVAPVSNVDRALESVAQAARAPVLAPAGSASALMSELGQSPAAGAGVLPAAGAPALAPPPPRVAPVTTPPQMSLPRRAF